MTGADAPGRGLVIHDLFRLRWLDTPRISPDGTQLAYLEISLDRAGDRLRYRVAVLALATGIPEWVDVADSVELAWSPDSRQVALAGVGGLWLASTNGGPARQVAGGSVTQPAWSPDGGRLAVTIDGSAGRRVHVLAADGDERTPLDHRGESHQARWSPDGRTLAFLDGDEIWQVDAELRRAPSRIVCPAQAVTTIVWSPDSTRLACLGRRDRDLVDARLRLWVINPTSGAASDISSASDAAIGSPVRGDDPRGTGRPALCWSSRTGRIYVESAVHGRGPLAWFDEMGASGLLLDGEHACLAPSMSDTGSIALVISGPDGPGDVWVVGEDGSNAQRITNADDATPARMAPTRSFQVAHDGVTIDAWLTGHPPPEPVPLVVNIHGGPYYAVGWRFTFEVQRLAAQGALVLTLNPRGSAGCGDAFATGNRGDWGGVDAADISAVIDSVARRPEVDETRIALWGVSYGGFMTQSLLARSDLFRTAISENGFSDLRAVWDSDPARTGFWKLALGDTPSAARFISASPLHSAALISTPLLLVHAEDDENCPIAHSEQMFAALRASGDETELVRLPGEGHLVNLVGRPSSRLRRAAAIDSWLERTLFQT